nr:hypothetical protein [Tanacetum cinerariifolium]
MTGEDKEEEEDALIDILKIVVEECKSLYKKLKLEHFLARLAKFRSNLKIYVMADVGAGISIMPKSLFKYLKLANLKKTSMVIEMDNMINKAPLGIVENIPVKIDKFLFHSDFVVVDKLETILLGRPFFATIHAQIDVFKGEILLGV